MCRWIAYRGETTALEHYVTEPSHSLISQSIHALESTASTNGDGFGLGWYGNHPEPGLYREIRPAWSDENLRYLCRHLQSHLYFAHVRAATGTADHPAELPSVCLRQMDVHAQRLYRQLEPAAPQVEALDPRRALSGAHRHDRLRSDLPRHSWAPAWSIRWRPRKRSWLR